MDHDLIKRYLRNECTPLEREQVKALMKSGEAQGLFDEVLDEHWTNDKDEASPEQLSMWKEKFNDRVQAQEVPIKPFYKYTWLKYAAVLAICILGAGSYSLLKLNPKEQAVTAMRETTNPNGKVIKIILADSSVITLNAASKLKYPTRFNGKTREVYLEGEAFFDVVHDPAHPFIVHTRKIKVSVLGTSFNVKAYHGDKKTAVVVATGKVGVLANEKGSKTFMLLPGDNLAYNDEGVVQSKANLSEIAPWKSGMFICHNETLENIAKQLERWYDVKVVFKKESSRYLRFNLKQKNDHLDNVMQTLKFAGNIKYEISGKTVTIR